MQASYQLQKSPSSLSSVHQPIQETGQDSAWNHGGDAQVLTQKHPHSFYSFCKGLQVLGQPIFLREAHNDYHHQDVPSAERDAEVKALYL